MSCTGDALGGKISGSLLTMAGGLGPVIPIVTVWWVGISNYGSTSIEFLIK